MEIKEIKSRLPITMVLEYYGLRADGHHRLHCPFHDDKTPSMQIYPSTDTYCCFSSNCVAGTGDVIEFIRLKENTNKREAILKATALAGGNEVSIPPVVTVPDRLSDIDSMTKEAVLTKVFGYFKNALSYSKKAEAYLSGRCLRDHQEIGFNSGRAHIESKNAHLVASMVNCGLLKPNAVKGYNVWAKDCIIFPLKNADHKIVSLYGRSISNDKASRHFYLTGREGLYPGYPSAGTTKLLLTESIIDAASLLQQKGIAANYTILSLYGTNGLTEEHQAAIVSLPQLEEIIFMLDADEAGEAAVARHTVTLKQLLPTVNISKVALPEGEDINSVLCTHDAASVLQSLIDARINFSFSIEKEKSTALPVNIVLSGNSKLNTKNAELLIYDNGDLYMEVLGGIKLAGLDRLKVTLKVRHKEKLDSPQWHSLDLYNQTQREQAIGTIVEKLELSTHATTHAFTELITELEDYRLKKLEALQPKEVIKNELSVAQRQQAMSELKHPKLLQRTKQLIAESGIVGETTNSLIAYLVYCTRKQAVPLHIMFLGSSGSGKTYLQEKIAALIPEEDTIEITQITENALYYFKQHELQHKLILIEDLDGAMSVFYPLRELQTKRRISKTVTLKDSKGNLKTITLTVEGPVCVSGCTTKEKIYEDNANRCILLYTDQTREQDKRINAYQTKLASGEINKVRENQYKELFKNMQRVLRPINIVNPYAGHIVLPEQVFKPRRTMTLLLGFIEAITFYHQYQREVKKDSSGQAYIETTMEDIAAAFDLLKEVLFSKSDELTKATRSFLEQLKSMLQATETSSFNAKSIRERLRINPGNMKRYLSELVRYGYIKGSGNRYRGSYEYSITNLQEYSSLTSAIENHFKAILSTLQAGVSSSVVQ